MPEKWQNGRERMKDMDGAKRKIRACLLFVVVLAVILGAVWYFQDRKEQAAVSEGTLVYQDIRNGLPEKSREEVCLVRTRQCI